MTDKSKDPMFIQKIATLIGAIFGFLLAIYVVIVSPPEDQEVEEVFDDGRS